MKSILVVHYSEIGTKGKNRGFFEGRLVSNLKNIARDRATIERQSGRLYVVADTDEIADQLLERFVQTPGVAYVAKGVSCDLDLGTITVTSLGLMDRDDIKTFGVKARRPNKEFPHSSNEVNRHVGAAIADRLGKKVDLTNPDSWLVIEITHKDAFLYTERHDGIGGLPVGSSGKLIASLSGGIDSPVAAQLMMKRGCPITFVHVRNENQFSADVEDKVKRLAERLSAYQPSSKLHILPFGDLQKQIIIFVPAKLRMIVYRRFMMRLLNKIAAEEKALGLVTGDCVGQVASQTMENINCIQDASALPVLSPLIGMNKEEIIQISKQLGTFDLSIEPYPDCCSFMIAPHPETRAQIEIIRQCEENIEGADKLVEECLASRITTKYSRN